MHEIDVDDLWPRDEEHRYRIYARRGDELHILAACPTAGGIGEALIAFHEDQKESGARLADLGVIGVLDVMTDRPTGEWVVLPWQRHEEPLTFGAKPSLIKEKR